MHEPGNRTMTRIVLQSKTGADGTLHLDVPLGLPDTEFEVEVSARSKMPEGKGWPPGHFDLLGSIDDETFTVHPQPEIPPPLEIQ
jgi:hypothetical protein